MRLIHIIGFVVLLTAVSCGNEKEQAIPTKEASTKQVIEQQENKFKRDETFALFQTMESEVLGFLYNSGVVLKVPSPQLNNSTEQYKVALNLGLAITGAVSSITSKNDKAFLDYASNLNQYAERLGLSDQILNKYTTITAAVKKGDWDKVEVLILDIKDAVFDELKENDMTSETIIIMVSGWIEGVYIASSSLNDNFKADATDILNKKNFVKYLKQNLSNLDNATANKTELVAIAQALDKIEPIMDQGAAHVYTEAEVKSLMDLTKPVHDAIVQ